MMQTELQLAIEIVKKAALFTKKLQRERAGQYLEKEDKSPVTAADFGSQLLALHYLYQAFPEDPVMGEENISELSQQKRPILDSLLPGLLAITQQQFSYEALIAHEAELRQKARPNRFWTIDPIDGTKGFLRGEQFAVALALIENLTPVLGVLGCPNLNTQAEPDPSGSGIIAYAVQGQGAWIQDVASQHAPARLTVSDRAEAAMARFVSSLESTGHSNNDSIRALKANLGNELAIQQFDSQAKYVMVAAGKFDLFLRQPPKNNPNYHEKIWDHAAGVRIVQEAGGLVTDLFGKPFDFSTGRALDNNAGVIVSNGHIHQAIVKAVSLLV